MSTLDLTKPLQLQLLDTDGPVCLILTARLVPVGDTDRFQPAGFPEVGHVIYDAPRTCSDGRKYREKVCIVDSPASMANHLEKVCLAGEGTTELHADLVGLPHVICRTDVNYSRENPTLDQNDARNRVIATTFTEGHRLASDYFLDGITGEEWVPESVSTTRSRNGQDLEQRTPAHWDGTPFRSTLRTAFGITEIKPNEKYFVAPGDWWNIVKAIFSFDPNSLVHGVMFAKEQIKIARMLTGHLEAFGASRVGRSGVKFNRPGNPKYWQPIFAVDEETAEEIRATFILDLALLRSFGRINSGLTNDQKRLLLDLAIWKVSQLLQRPFRYRTQCFLRCQSVAIYTENESAEKPLAISPAADTGFAPVLPAITMADSIRACAFPANSTTFVYYPATDLFTLKTKEAPKSDESDESNDQEDSQEGE